MQKEYTTMRRIYASVGFAVILGSPFIAIYLVHLNSLINKCLTF